MFTLEIAMKEFRLELDITKNFILNMYLCFLTAYNLLTGGF